MFWFVPGNIPTDQNGSSQEPLLGLVQLFV
jgi:hypothetical protein